MRAIFFGFVLASALILQSSLCFSATNDKSLTFQVIQSQLIFDSSNIESVTPVKVEDNRYSLKIRLKPAAAEELKQMTKNGIGKKANMVFNGRIISAATIQTELGGDFQLAAGFSKDEAEELANALMHRG